MDTQKTKSKKQLAKGPKQIVDENESTLKFYSKVIGGATLLHFGVCIGFFLDDLLTWTYILMNVITISSYSFSYFFLYRISRPTYSATSRNLVDPGTDLNMEGGISEHAKDVILLSAITQVLATAWRYSWLIYLAIPIRVCQILWVNFLGPYFFAAPAEDDQENAGKKKEKRERRVIRQR